MVNVTGLILEYDGNGTWPDSVTEIHLTGPDTPTGNIEATGATAAEPDPVVLDVSVFSDPATIEPYEGVLARIEAVTVDGVGVAGAEWQASGVRIDERFFLPNGLGLGDTFESITGIVDYNQGTMKLVPRDGLDFVGYVPAP